MRFMQSLVMVSLAVSGAALAAPRLAVEKSIDLPAPPAEVWKTIGDFGSLGWHPAVAGTEITAGRNNVAGAQRTITLKDGAKIVETLKARKANSLTYAIDSSPLPVSGYVSTLSVAKKGKGSHVVWKSRFERDPKAAGVDDAKAQEIIGGIYAGGFEALAKQFGAH